MYACNPVYFCVVWKVSRELVCPLLSMTQVLHRHVGELTALLLKKDAEIQDYKENGAVLSRGAYSIYKRSFTCVHVVNSMIDVIDRSASD